MSDESNMIGYVGETYPKALGADAVRRMNDAVLASLPEADTSPPLTRALFAATGEGWAQGSFRGRRLIHFGGKFNHFGEDIDDWLEKFEALLRRMYWYEAEVLYVTGYARPSVRVRYRVSPSAIASYHSDDPRPAQSWEIEATQLRLDVEPTNAFVPELLETLRSRAGQR